MAGSQKLLEITQSSVDANHGNGNNTIVVNQLGSSTGSYRAVGGTVTGFAGGLSGITFTNGQAKGINPRATNIAVLAGDNNGLFSDATVRNNFSSSVTTNQGNNITVSQATDASIGAGPLAILTQKVAGKVGNKAIDDVGSPNFETTANDVRGFVGGKDGVTFTNGQQKGAPAPNPTNIAVIVGSIDNGGTPGS